MRLLKIRADGLPLYKKPFEVSFYAAQRVESNHLDAVSNLFGNIYVNKAEAFVGINASGKTTALDIIAFVYFLVQGRHLNDNYATETVKENQPIVFDVDFFYATKLYHLQSEVIKTKDISGKYELKITAEKLWAKNISGKISKRNLLNFQSAILVDDRAKDHEFLSDDVSIAIALQKRDNQKQRELLAYYSAFTLPAIFMPNDSVPSEIITLLDPSIEYITTEHINERQITRLKFHGQEELVLANRADIGVYLSSGTLKGITVFSQAIEVLKYGGYLFVDEIETHFNRELVVSLLRLFLDRKTNPKGAVIVFSTHYSELLDVMERNDSVFITRNCAGLTVDNLNDLLSRNDLKRSEVYESNFLGGTAPKYKSLEALRKSVVKSLEG